MMKKVFISSIYIVSVVSSLSVYSACNIQITSMQNPTFILIPYVPNNRQVLSPTIPYSSIPTNPDSSIELNITQVYKISVSNADYTPAIVSLYSGGNPGTTVIIRPTGTSVSASDTPVNITSSGGIISFTPGKTPVTGKYKPSQGVPSIWLRAQADDLRGTYMNSEPSWCKDSVSAGTPISLTLMTVQEMHSDVVIFNQGVKYYSGTITPVGNPGSFMSSVINFMEIPAITVSPERPEIDFGNIQTGITKTMPLSFEIASNVINQPVTLDYNFQHTINVAEFSIQELNGNTQETTRTGVLKNTSVKLTRNIVMKSSAQTSTGAYEGILNITATLP
ncbi:hypothetical protein H7D82_000777 [Salmonella enterica]|nr:hypothetical protein [Salmonella enterica]EKB7612252.1 hypothetical protein [Salmonella enterica]